MFTQPFTFNEINEALLYDDDSGLLYWRQVVSTGAGSGRRRIGDMAICVDRKGYGFVIYKHLHIKAHRVVWLLNMGEWPMFRLDHIDLDKLNNRMSNLRPATNSQNKANAPPYAGRPFKGVVRTAQHRWRAMIQCNGKNTHIGVFDSIEDAARAYDARAMELFGEFARTNFPSGL